MESQVTKSLKSTRTHDSAPQGLLYRLFIKEKLNNPFGYVFILSLTAVFSAVIATQGLKSGILLSAVLIGVPVVFAAMFNLQFGLLLTLVAAFFVLWFKKFLPGNPPLGLVVDILIGVMFFGMFIRQIRERDWSFLKNPISLVVLIWIGYNLLMFFNPEARSREAWFYTVRGMALFIVLYYITVYIFNQLKIIERFIKICIALSLAAALYGLYQEFAGLPSWELNWLRSDPRLFKLVYQWGKLRIFSFISDPSTFGILMAYMGMFCLVLATGPFSALKRWLLFLAGSLMLFSMLYSGTRTAYVLVPVGLTFYTLLTLNKKVVFMMVIAFLGGTALVMMPTSNPTIYRFQSAFKPKKDASMNTRLTNQKRIQPFIQSHPIGGGLGSTGYFGKRFSPGTMLAEFPPDSGFVRVAVELGWIGLLLYCIFLFVILRTAISHYVSSVNPKIRVYYLAFLIMMIAMVVSNYPQDSLVMLPTSIIFYISLAAIVRLKDYDTDKKLKA
ncbi:MAG: hypothetical protein KatS3mg031_0327 [Chitinophagales bacterium]|nr:MAG: hypothetical protein KatS3mg031_0327 [Chitinophagales bacterium]